jgi:hypothetical protein
MSWITIAAATIIGFYLGILVAVFLFAVPDPRG